MAQSRAVSSFNKNTASNADLAVILLNLTGKAKLTSAEQTQALDIIERLANTSEARRFLNIKSECGSTPLIHAATNGHIDIIKKLSQQVSVCLNEQNKDGYTALFEAVVQGNVVIVKLLVAAGADVNISYFIEDVKQERPFKDCVGEPPLVCAAYSGHQSIVAALIQAGAPVDATSGRAGAVETALICACREGHAAVVEQLLAAGASPHIQDKAGCTALMYAVREKRNEIILKLLNVKSDVVDPVKKFINIEDEENRTALYYAVEGNHVEAVRWLIEAGVFLDVKAFAKANEQGSSEMVTLLVNAVLAAKIQYQRDSSSDFIEEAISSNQDAVAEKLVRSGLAQHLSAALEVAILNCRFALINLLFEYGADIRNIEKNDARRAAFDSLEALLKSQENQSDPRVLFCFGKLREQQGRMAEAKEYYQRLCHMPKQKYPAAYRCLGELHEQDGQSKSAVPYYIAALTQDDLLSLTRLVSVAQKTFDTVCSVKPESTQENKKSIDNNEGEIINYKKLMLDIYQFLASHPNACLAAEQWLFLATHALGGNIYFASSKQGASFTMWAAKKAEKTAKINLCGILVKSDFSKDEIFEEFPKLLDAMYVLSGKNLFYVNKKMKSCDAIKFEREDALAKFKKHIGADLLDDYQYRIMSANELKAITEITGHRHVESETLKEAREIYSSAQRLFDNALDHEQKEVAVMFKFKM